MKQLKDQVREFVAFDREYYPVYGDDLSRGRFIGGQDESHRLAPLNNLWPDVVSALEKIDRICMANGDIRGTDLHCHASITLAKIKEAVERKV